MTTTTFFLFLIPILAFILLAVNFIFAPHNPYEEKGSVFECGFHSFLGQNRTQFSISFFIFALLFLLFDLEILLVYPYIVSAYTNEILGLIIMLVFFVLLTLGFVFELGKKALKIDSRQVLSTTKQISYKSYTLESSFNFLELGIRRFHSSRHLCVNSETEDSHAKTALKYINDKKGYNEHIESRKQDVLKDAENFKNEYTSDRENLRANSNLSAEDLESFDRETKKVLEQDENLASNQLSDIDSDKQAVLDIWESGRSEVKQYVRDEDSQYVSSDDNSSGGECFSSAESSNHEDNSRSSEEHSEEDNSRSNEEHSEEEHSEEDNSRSNEEHSEEESSEEDNSRKRPREDSSEEDNSRKRPREDSSEEDNSRKRPREDSSEEDNSRKRSREDSSEEDNPRKKQATDTEASKQDRGSPIDYVLEKQACEMPDP
jgi:NADH-ubiquinone oxidoreductase chain 3